MASLNLQMIWILTLALILASAMAQLPPLERNFDIVIVGATPAGIMAAVAATRASNGTARILILERTAFIGGLPANGLGATDIATRGATAGLFLEFVERVAEHYAREFGPESRQAADSSGYFFEPKVAEAVLQGFLDEVAESVTVLLGRQFDALPRYAKVAAGKLTRIRVLNRARGNSEWYGAKVFKHPAPPSSSPMDFNRDFVVFCRCYIRRRPHWCRQNPISPRQGGKQRVRRDRCWRGL